ncbi:hypothetical protein GDO86_014163 [Hymenochirus boettgeri]|uniref:G-protein coupled receptors family 1 profile domain-containing protein n=1 Tax=Hymenochirus boettgeri TaxID=247094 RepID=A0A8T2JTG0_9PIPI|nr:hypothetical protein GDO86_014163 [Hymenochirus boettgeri]
MDLNEMNSTWNSTLTCSINKEFTFLYLPSVYLIVFLVGLLGNGIGLWNLCTKQKKWNSVNIFVLNLGIADLLYVITLPFFVCYYRKREVWQFGVIFCRITRCLFHVNMYSSISFLTCISFQRYLGIVHPLKNLVKFQSLRYPVLISLLVWVWVVIQVAPSFFISKNDANLDQCHDSTTNEEESVKMFTIYTGILTFTGFFIPFLFIVMCYAKVLVVLRENENIDPVLKRKSITLVGIVIILFIICFFPFYILRNFNMFSRVWQFQGMCTPSLKRMYIAYQVTRGLASMNSAINPLLYFVTNENLVLTLKKMRLKTFHAFAYLRRNRNLKLTADTENLDL